MAIDASSSGSATGPTIQPSTTPADPVATPDTSTDPADTTEAGTQSETDTAQLADFSRWMVKYRTQLDTDGNGLVSFDEFQANKNAVGISSEAQTGFNSIDQATFDAYAQIDGTNSDGGLDVRIVTADTYLSEQIAQFNNPKPSEYLLHSLVIAGKIQDPWNLTDADQSLLTDLESRLADGGISSLSSDEQQWITNSARTMLTVDAYVGSIGDTSAGATDAQISSSVELLTKRIRYETGREQTQPAVSEQNFDYQSLLAGGTDADRLDLFMKMSVANQIKADQNGGNLGLTDTTGEQYAVFWTQNPPDSAPVTQGGSLENWRPDHKQLDEEQMQFVNDWVSTNGPITKDSVGALTQALGAEFSMEGFSLAYSESPDPWVGQKENLDILADAEQQAYREWNADGTPKVSSPTYRAAQLAQQLHLNYAPDGTPELDFQQGRLAANDRDALATPATIFDRGEWVWNDPNNPPTRDIHHEPAQSIMGPTGDGWTETVTDDTKIGDLNYGSWKYTAREGAAPISDTKTWLSQFDGNAGDLLQPVTVDRNTMSTAGSILAGIFTLGIANLAYTGANKPEYSPLQNFVLGKLQESNRSTDLLDKAMSIAHEDWVNAMWAAGGEVWASFATVFAPGAGVIGNAVGTAARAAVSSAESVVSNLTRAGIATLHQMIDPIGLLGMARWAKDSIPSALAATGTAIANLFGENSPVTAALNKLFSRATQTSDPSELQPLLSAAEEALKKAGPLNADQSNILNQVQKTKDTLQRGSEAQGKLQGSRLGSDNISLGQPPVSLNETQTASITWGKDPFHPELGSVVIDGKTFSVAETVDGKNIIGTPDGSGRFRATDTDGRFLGLYYKAENGKYFRGGLKGGEGQETTITFNGAEVQGAKLHDSRLFESNDGKTFYQTSDGWLKATGNFTPDELATIKADLSAGPATITVGGVDLTAIKIGDELFVVRKGDDGLQVMKRDEKTGRVVNRCFGTRNDKSVVIGLEGGKVAGDSIKSWESLKGKFPDLKPSFDEFVKMNCNPENILDAARNRNGQICYLEKTALDHMLVGTPHSPNAKTSSGHLLEFLKKLGKDFPPGRKDQINELVKKAGARIQELKAGGTSGDEAALKANKELELALNKDGILEEFKRKLQDKLQEMIEKGDVNKNTGRSGFHIQYENLQIGAADNGFIITAHPGANKNTDDLSNTADNASASQASSATPESGTDGITVALPKKSKEPLSDETLAEIGRAFDQGKQVKLGTLTRGPNTQNPRLSEMYKVQIGEETYYVEATTDAAGATKHTLITEDAFNAATDIKKTGNGWAETNP